MTDRVWTIKGVSDRTREAAVEAAHATGLNVGDWVDRALARTAEEARHPRPPPATREDVAEVVREQLAPVVDRLEALEGKAGRRTRPEPAGEVAAPPATAQEVGAPTGEGPAPAGVQRTTKGRPRRELPDEVRARIEELHRAGRSAYAISKELGVAYNAVRAHLRALGTA